MSAARSLDHWGDAEPISPFTLQFTTIDAAYLPRITIEQIGGLLDSYSGDGAWEWVKQFCTDFLVRYTFFGDDAQMMADVWLVLSDDDAFAFRLMWRFDRYHLADVHF